MTQTSGGPAIDRDGPSEPATGERDRGSAVPAGNASEKVEKPSPGDRGETSSADDGASAGLDTAHDRAS